MLWEKGKRIVSSKIRMIRSMRVRGNGRVIKVDLMENMRISKNLKNGISKEAI